MRTVMTKLRSTGPPAWIALVTVLAIAGTVALGLRARAAGEDADLQDPHVAEADAHEHEADGHEDEEVVVELDEEALALAELRTERVRRREMSEWLEAPGVIHANPDETAVVSPSVAGSIESVRAATGDRVRRGEVLVVLRSPELATAQAEVAAAAAELSAAEQALQRRQSLADEGEFGAAPYEEAKRAYDEAREALNLAEDRLRRTRRLAALGTPTRPAVEDAATELSEAREAVRTAQADLASAKASLAAAERVASRAEASPGKSASRAAAEAKVAEAETALVTAQEASHRLEGLLPEGLTTRQELDRSRADEAKARAELEAARYELRTADDGADEARLVVQTAQQDIERAEAALTEARARLAVAEGRHERERAVAEEDIPAQQQVAEAETEVAIARAAFEQAKTAWEREQRLHKSGARSRDALADLEANVAAARARLTAARRRVDALGHGSEGRGGRISIKAPVSGKVSLRDARVGAMAEAGEALLEITGVRSVWVEAGFYEKDVPLLSTGQPMELEVTAFPGHTFETTVSSIDPGLDEHTRKATVRGIVDNEGGRLLPDMFAKVRVRVGTASSVAAVPQQAVQDDGHCAFVFVEEEPGHYRRAEVQTGRHSNGLLEITSGVEVGETIVTDGAFLLKSETSEIADSCGH